MKLPVALFTIVFGLTVSQANGLERDFTKIDQHARNAPDKVRNDVQRLTRYLVRPAQDDIEKVRSFYVWITENIAYDVQLFQQYRPSRYQQILPNDVLKRKRAVCQGYAELFMEMCRLAEIPCHVVAGYSKGLGYVPQKELTTADHAWNAVRLNENWYLLDVTWGSGGINEQMRYIKEFNEDYFLASPETFVLDHLPLEPMWQLLGCPVPVDTYLAGDEPVQLFLANATGQCIDFRSMIADYRSKSEVERYLYASEQAYTFNPANPVVLVRGYLNYANHLMSSIPSRLTSREAMLDAANTQEHALEYLRKAEHLLEKVDRDDAKQEKQLVRDNISTSEKNLSGLRKALKQ